MHRRLLFFCVLGLLSSYWSNGQSIVIDSVFNDGKLEKIYSKKDGQLFGPAKEFWTNSYPPFRAYYFYLNNQKTIEMIPDNDRPGQIGGISAYKDGIRLFKEGYVLYGIQRRFYKSDPNPCSYLLEYDIKERIRSISFSNHEKIVLHPNYTVKSITTVDHLPSGVVRSYYELSEEGILAVEGQFAPDSFRYVNDTLEAADLRGGNAVLNVEVLLKHGDWFYYTPEGILEEKKTFHYQNERNGRKITQ